jgi:hypothetical protein
MKKYFISLFTSIVIITVTLPFLSAGGCSDKEEKNVGYHSIYIPEFTEDDYIQMLDSTNKEIQYNAILNLYKDYDKILTSDSLKGTPQYDSALAVYQKIFSLMDSKHTWVSSAAVSFIGSFEYNRAVFVEYALKNNNPSLNVQLQIIMDIALDTNKNQQLLSKKINFLSKQSSWLLQNSRYQLVGENDRISMDIFMQEYKSANEEYKKLLILDMLTAHMNDSVFSFLTNEYEVTKYDRIKKLIITHLPEADNPELVIQWYNKHFNVLENNMERMISNLNSKNEIYSKLILLALTKGWKPSLILHKGDIKEYAGEPYLYISLFLIKYEEAENNSLKLRQNSAGKRIEDFLLKDPELKNGWLSFEKRMLRYPLPQDLITHHQILTEKYLEQTRLLLQKFQIDTALFSDFFKEINYQAKELNEKKIRKLE